jgi:type IV/VI secretion system ImpK/VasF family protein
MNDAQRSRYEARGRFCQLFTDFIITVLVTIDRRQGSAESVALALEAELERIRNFCLGNRFPAAEVDEALFGVCAWADEMLMNAVWPEVAEQWVKVLLQQTFFKTNLAGEEFFVRLERLSHSDSLAYDVYALCLANGFKGKFVQNLAMDDLDHLRQETLSRSLVLSGLNDANGQTFASINKLVQPKSAPQSYWRAAVIVVSTLLALKVLDWILQGVLSYRVYALIEGWK